MSQYLPFIISRHLIPNVAVLIFNANYSFFKIYWHPSVGKNWGKAVYLCIANDIVSPQIHFSYLSVISSDCPKSIVTLVSLTVFDNYRMYYILLAKHQVGHYLRQHIIILKIWRKKFKSIGLLNLFIFNFCRVPSSAVEYQLQ